MRRIFACIIVALLSLAPATARGQLSLEARDPLHVYLITFGPGEDPWEKFGHDCVVIEDDDSSLAYNWGVFSFGKGLSGYIGFGWHFLQGRLLYSMQSYPTRAMLDDYKAAGRSVLVQELRLTMPQKLDLKNRLEANDTEANRYYLYDYFKKNCTTMARDAIDQVIGGQIAATLQKIPTTATFRWHDRRTTADTLWLYVFLDYSLGHDVDRPLSAWEECFLPGVLARQLPLVKVPGSDGKPVSIVLWQDQIATGTFAERAVPPPSFFYGFLGTGIGIGGLLCLLGIGSVRFRILRWIFALGVMIWSTLAGSLGALMTFAWFTNHEAAKWNENWFQGNPASLLLIVLAPMAFRWPRLALRVAFVVLGLSAFGLVAKITPWFYQVNGSMIAAALPIHAGIAWGLLRSTARPAPPVVPVETPSSEAVDAA